ncbi:MAG: hypothetical protein FWF51_04650, partial [Chitinivibrionia bacterium]|nr:hypothetical protein [Chitinivibrionia bacterium]
LSQTYFTINTAEQLAGLAELVNGGNDMNGKTFTLGANIMLNDTTNWQNWETTAPANTWTAIGNGDAGYGDNAFYGIFDGARYVVVGVYINNASGVGLFGYVDGATIKNLGVVASCVKGNIFVGGLVGVVNGYGGTITNCYYTGNVSGGDLVGGLAGVIQPGDCSIANSYFAGNVSGVESVGGLVGGNYGGSITNSYSAGNVSGGGYEVGGLVGGNYGGAITNSYSAGNVSGSGNEVGGLVGGNYSGAITNSYYDSQTSGRNDTNRGAPKTTTEMKTQATFVGWNFNDVWEIDNEINGGYPYLSVFFVPVSNISSVITSAVYNETKALSATIEPANAYKKTISWNVIGEGATINANTITFTKLGQVTIKATIENGLGKGSNYTKDFVINVAKANYDMNGITFADKTVTHDGAAQSILINGTLPSGVTVTYTGNGQTAVGEYQITANFATTNENYNVPSAMTATLTIAAAQENSITPTKSGNGLGIILEKNVVSDSLKIVKIALPDGKDGKITKTVIYDNTGNVVFSGEGKNASAWNLRNKSGRIVANGSYLVIVEAKSANGKTYWYSAKVGVKR